MKILQVKKLDSFCRKHSNAKSPVESWLSTVKRCSWKTPQDIKNTFNSVDFIKNNQVIFNIGGNNFRLVVKVIYVDGNIHIKWIGTHAEYDKLRFD